MKKIIITPPTAKATEATPVSTRPAPAGAQARAKQPAAPPTPAEQRRRCAMRAFEQATKVSSQVARKASGNHLLLVAALVVTTVFAAMIGVTCKGGLPTNIVAFTPALVVIGFICMNLANSFRALRHIREEWQKYITAA